MLFLSDEQTLLLQIDFETQEQLFPGLWEVHPDLSGTEGESLEKAALRYLRGGSCGVPSAMFGLPGICLVWIPKNEFHVIMFIAMRAFSSDVTIMWNQPWYFGWDVVFFRISGGPMDADPYATNEGPPDHVRSRYRATAALTDRAVRSTSARQCLRR